MQNISAELFTVRAPDEINALHFPGRVLAKLQEGCAEIQVSSFRHPVWLTAAVEVHQRNTPAAFVPLDETSCLGTPGEGFLAVQITSGIFRFPRFPHEKNGNHVTN